MPEGVAENLLLGMRKSRRGADASRPPGPLREEASALMVNLAFYFYCEDWACEVHASERRR